MAVQFKSTSTIKNMNMVYDTDISYFVVECTAGEYSSINFKYVLKLYEYVSGSYILRNTVKLPAGSSSYYNPTYLIKDYVSSDPPSRTTNYFNHCINSVNKFKSVLSYEYNSPLVTGATANQYQENYFWNGCQIYENYDFMYSLNNFILSATTDCDFLTPVREFYIDESEPLYLYFITAETLPPNLELNILFYDNTNTALEDITVPCSNLSGNTMYSFGCGIANLISGSTSVPTDWSYYKIYFSTSSAGIPPSARLTVNDYIVYRKDRCYRYDKTTLVWLNELGGYSTFTFNYKKYITNKYNRSYYDKVLPLGYSTSTTFTGSKKSAQYQVNEEETIQLSSDFLKDSEVQLIKSLLRSVDVYVMEQSPTNIYNFLLVPYDVIDEEFVQLNNKNDKIFSYSIKIRKSKQQLGANG